MQFTQHKASFNRVFLNVEAKVEFFDEGLSQDTALSPQDQWIRLSDPAQGELKSKALFLLEVMRGILSNIYELTPAKDSFNSLFSSECKLFSLFLQSRNMICTSAQADKIIHENIK